MDNGTLRLVIFSFILSLVFPTMAYTFTTFGEQPDNFDMTLTTDQLQSSGIQLSDAETYEVTYDDVAQQYTVKNNTMRVQWKNPTLGSPYFSNQQQTYIERILGTWFFPKEMDVILNPSQGSQASHTLVNSTIVNNFDTDYNWTKWTIVENSLTVFVTTSLDDNNITKAIFETGVVNVTVASEFFGGTDINYKQFVNWYLRIVTGQAGDWGLPTFMIWIVRIFSFITFLAGVLLAKEFIPFLN